MSDTIDRQAVIDEIEYELEMINSALDSITLDFNTRERLCQRRGEAREILNSIQQLPSAQPEPNYDEWCTDCKEYDKERHCCPRWNRVIRETLKDAQPERKTGMWVHGKLIYSDISIATCTTCGKRVPVGNFCMDCGSYNGEKERRTDEQDD